MLLTKICFLHFDVLIADEPSRNYEMFNKDSILVRKAVGFNVKTFLGQKIESSIIILRNIYTSPFCRSPEPPQTTIPAKFQVFDFHIQC